MLEVMHATTIPWLDAAVAKACAQVPPAWELDGAVAVDPWTGLASLPLEEAETAALRRGKGGIVPDAAKLSALGAPVTPGEADLLDWVPTHAEEAAAKGLGDWPSRLADHASRWCAAWSEGARRGWPTGAPGEGLWETWHRLARKEGLVLEGCAPWEEHVASMPKDPRSAIATAVARSGLAPAEAELWLSRLLGTLPGWASQLRRPSWEQGKDLDDGLLGLLAIRAASDVWLSPVAGLSVRQRTTEPLAARVAAWEALEERETRLRFGAVEPPPGPDAEPRLEAVFCIDVRSERLRRHLEARHPGVRTHGVAGFFGLDFRWQGASHAPALLRPRLLARGGEKARKASWKGLMSSPAAFSLVESFGLLAGAALAKDALFPARKPTSNHGPDLLCNAEGEPLPLAERVALATGLLKAAGLVEVRAAYVLLCGHGSRSANNPHDATLQCGACGGCSGEYSARLAAGLLQDPQVRSALAGQGIEVDEGVRFVPAVHDTLTDRIVLLDGTVLPGDEAGWIEAAGQAARQERAHALGIATEAEGLEARMERRGSDPAQLRPEWSLAGNAWFFVGRRERMRGRDLEGRSFLHDYDAEADPDGSALGGILGAPGVVTAWINLQYLASSLHAHEHGAGTKLLHSRVGMRGVVEGDGGDLRPGLPTESVLSAGGRSMHPPLRLSWVVEAPAVRIETALAQAPAAHALVRNGRVRLWSLDPQAAVLRLWKAGEWIEPMDSGKETA
jgi:hypothetical protein